MKYRIYKIGIDAGTSADKTGSKKYVVWGHILKSPVTGLTVPFLQCASVVVGGRTRILNEFASVTK